MANERTKRIKAYEAGTLHWSRLTVSERAEAKARSEARGDMTEQALRASALQDALRAGLDADTADAVAGRVLVRAREEDTAEALAALHDSHSWVRWIKQVIREEIQCHAAP